VTPSEFCRELFAK